MRTAIALFVAPFFCNLALGDDLQGRSIAPGWYISKDGHIIHADKDGGYNHSTGRSLGTRDNGRSFRDDQGNEYRTAPMTDAEKTEEFVKKRQAQKKNKKHRTPPEKVEHEIELSSDVFYGSCEKEGAEVQKIVCRISDGISKERRFEIAQPFCPEDSKLTSIEKPEIVWREWVSVSKAHYFGDLEEGECANISKIRKETLTVDEALRLRIAESAYESKVYEMPSRLLNGTISIRSENLWFNGYPFDQKKGPVEWHQGKSGPYMTQLYTRIWFRYTDDDGQSESSEIDTRYAKIDPHSVVEVGKRAILGLGSTDLIDEKGTSLVWLWQTDDKKDHIKLVSLAGRKGVHKIFVSPNSGYYLIQTTPKTEKSQTCDTKILETDAQGVIFDEIPVASHRCGRNSVLKTKGGDLFLVVYSEGEKVPVQAILFSPTTKQIKWSKEISFPAPADKLWRRQTGAALLPDGRYVVLNVSVKILDSEGNPGVEMKAGRGEEFKNVAYDEKNNRIVACGRRKLGSETSLGLLRTFSLEGDEDGLAVLGAERMKTVTLNKVAVASDGKITGSGSGSGSYSGKDLAFSVEIPAEQSSDASLESDSPQ